MKNRIMNFLKKKKAGDETLIVKIILMVVAVVLCILFRNTLTNIIISLLNGVQNNINGIYTSGSMFLR